MNPRILAFLPVALAACVSNPPSQAAKPAADYRCDFLPERPQPGWVVDESRVPGYFHGKAAAGRGEAVEQQKQAARSAALKGLSQSIRVSVQSEQKSETRVARSGAAETVDREIRETTRISSNLTLSMVEDAGEWLDRGSCTYWVRLRISESALRFERLRGLLADVRDPARPLAERREALESAEALLPQIDFTRIPDAEGRDHYRQQLERERQAVAAQKSDAIAVVALDAGLPQALARDLMSRLPGGQQFKLEALGCNRLDECIGQARRHGAGHLLFAHVTHSEAAGKMGGRTARLNVEITIADTRTGRTTWGPKQASQALLTFGDFSESDWREAAVKAADAEPFRPVALCLAPKDAKTCS